MYKPIYKSNLFRLRSLPDPSCFATNTRKKQDFYAQSAGKNKYPAEDLLEKGRGSGVTEPVAGGQLWKIDAEGTVRQVRGNEERAGAGTAG